MIQNLLEQIAKRGHANSASMTEEANFSLPFPAHPIQHTLASTNHDAQSLWREAKIACQLYAAQSPAPRLLPYAFEDFSNIHALIGSLVWSERKSLGKGITHVLDAQGTVIAAIYPKERQVMVRKRANLVEAKHLSLRELPSSAQKFDAGIASFFDRTSLYMVLWYYGQVLVEAMDELPEELLSKSMLLRRLPLIDPQALDLRHLHLIHLFSGGPLQFSQLLSKLQPEAMKSVCADLASLYLTGCLVSSQAESA